MLPRFQEVLGLSTPGLRNRKHLAMENQALVNLVEILWSPTLGGAARWPPAGGLWGPVPNLDGSDPSRKGPWAHLARAKMGPIGPSPK